MFFLMKIVSLGLFFGSDTMQQPWDGYRILSVKKPVSAAHLGCLFQLSLSFRVSFISFDQRSCLRKDLFRVFGISCSTFAFFQGTACIREQIPIQVPAFYSE
jgi:hypothetical protein